MSERSKELQLLQIRLENLLLRQQDFEAEIRAVQAEVARLQGSPAANTSEQEANPRSFDLPPGPVFPPPLRTTGSLKKATGNNMFSGKSDLEKFIGENLINKLGILILIIGVGIGAKYAIDHELISPLTRILLGYAVGAGLMLLAIRLKAKYGPFSAVLLSGSIAILYFITYLAYSLYGLFGQELAFSMMVVFTAFTVLAATRYNRQVIALIGLAGAYAIPFLLSNGSDKVAILFSYVGLINIGILILSFKRDWRLLFYTAFGFTWIILISWQVSATNTNLASHFNAGMVFAIASFVTFYSANLAYKVIKSLQLDYTDVLLVVLNAFIFYGCGVGLLLALKPGNEYLGLFTLLNAIVHFLVCLLIYRRNLGNRNLFYLILALVVIFTTLVFPVQMDGNWVTLFWMAEAAILFWIGRSKAIPIYEKIAFPVIFLAFFSLIQDWVTYNAFLYNDKGVITVVSTPFFNVLFLTGILSIIAFAIMNYVNGKTLTHGEGQKQGWMASVLNFTLPAFLLLMIYITFAHELSEYFSIKAAQSNYYAGYALLSAITSSVYTLVFAAALNLFAIKQRSKDIAITALVISFIALLYYLFYGQLILSALRENYLNAKTNTSWAAGVGVRYISIFSVALFMITVYRLCRIQTFQKFGASMFNYILYITLLWMLSSELINLIDLSHGRNTYKLGLSILWGMYSLFLVSMGLWKNKKQLRIGAIALFGVTLVKLFLYDIAYLSTIAKTIVFVSLGALLLTISFLYNKYKHLIIDDAKV